MGIEQRKQSLMAAILEAMGPRTTSDGTPSPNNTIISASFGPNGEYTAPGSLRFGKPRSTHNLGQILIEGSDIVIRVSNDPSRFGEEIGRLTYAGWEDVLLRRP